MIYTTYILNMDLTEVCSYLILLHYSLKASTVTSTAAIGLATALQNNKSLEELKYAQK